MFSPPVNVPANTTSRNSKRRQRNGSDDSLALRHNPKRLRRSGLTQETFQPPEAPEVNGHTESAENEPTTNGYTKASSQKDAAVDTTSLTIRDRGVTRPDRENRNTRIQEGRDLVGVFEQGDLKSKMLTERLPRPRTVITSSHSYLLPRINCKDSIIF
ncbi:MAG: hypothetical protein Q9191_008569, partial [Dirinaria sp. TL-2023a]